MKFTDKLIDKYGVDKMLHLFGGAWLVSLISIYGIFAMFLMEIAVIIISFIKEYKMDKFPDNKDIQAGAIGGLISMSIYCILFFLKTLF